MNQALRTYLDEQARAVDEDVRQAIEACDGDATAALRCALIANAFLMEEIEQLNRIKELLRNTGS